MEGTRRTRSPSLREQVSTPRNWRIWPWSSRTWRERSGNRAVSSFKASATVVALQFTFGAPSVKRRNAVGISMTIDISSSPWMRFSLRTRASSRRAELRVEVSLESVKARRDGFRGREFGGDCVGGFQTVAGDADDGGFVRLNAILSDEFLCDTCGDPARGFREDAFGFSEQLDRVHDLRIGNIFGPAAGFANELDGIGPVGRIADRQ